MSIQFQEQGARSHWVLLEHSAELIFQLYVNIIMCKLSLVCKSCQPLLVWSKVLVECMQYDATLLLLSRFTNHT